METHDIKIQINHQWCPAYAYQAAAYQRFKAYDSLIPHEHPQEIDEDGYLFKIQRTDDRLYGGSYLIREDGTCWPIVDWNDIKIFRFDIHPFEWHPTRNYQKWAYLDFLYNRPDNLTEITYTNRPLNLNEKSIPIEYLMGYESQPIKFKILCRNDTRSGIFFQQYPSLRSNIIEPFEMRISDNVEVRQGYLGFVHRMTMDIGMVSYSGALHHDIGSMSLAIPGSLISLVTDDESAQCLACYTNLRNLRFSPCHHSFYCDRCYRKSYNKFECPLCRQKIERLEAYDPRGES